MGFDDHQLALALQAEASRAVIDSLQGNERVLAQLAWVAKWEGPPRDHYNKLGDWWKKCKQVFARRVEAAYARWPSGQPPPDVAPASSSAARTAAEQLGINATLSASRQWVATHAPTILNQTIVLGEPSLTPNGRHVKRTLSAMVEPVGGEAEDRVQQEVLYSVAHVGELAAEAQARKSRARMRERRAIMGLSQRRSTHMEEAQETARAMFGALVEGLGGSAYAPLTAAADTAVTYEEDVQGAEVVDCLEEEEDAESAEASPIVFDPRLFSLAAILHAIDSRVLGGSAVAQAIAVGEPEVHTLLPEDHVARMEYLSQLQSDHELLLQAVADRLGLALTEIKRGLHLSRNAVHLAACGLSQAPSWQLAVKRAAVRAATAIAARQRWSSWALPSAGVA